MILKYTRTINTNPRIPTIRRLEAEDIISLYLSAAWTNVEALSSGRKSCTMEDTDSSKCVCSASDRVCPGLSEAKSESAWAQSSSSAAEQVR